MAVVSAGEKLRVWCDYDVGDWEICLWYRPNTNRSSQVYRNTGEIYHYTLSRPSQNILLTNPTTYLCYQHGNIIRSCGNMVILYQVVWCQHNSWVCRGARTITLVSGER